jgi:hypothetical protein
MFSRWRIGICIEECFSNRLIPNRKTRFTSGNFGVSSTQFVNLKKTYAKRDAFSCFGRLGRFVHIRLRWAGTKTRSRHK